MGPGEDRTQHDDTRDRSSACYQCSLAVQVAGPTSSHPTANSGSTELRDLPHAYVRRDGAIRPLCPFGQTHARCSYSLRYGPFRIRTPRLASRGSVCRTDEPLAAETNR